MELLAEYDGASTQLAMYLAAQLYDAAQDLSGVEPGELWDRFLAWTRTSRLPRSCLGPGYR